MARFHPQSRRARRAAMMGGVAALAVGLSCDRDKAATPGEVMVEVTTDLQVADDLNSVQFVVSANGVVQLDQTSMLGPGNLALPATFGVVVGPDADPSTPAKIDVIGYRTGADGVTLPQIVNEAVVTIPESGIVLLRMPLDYLCLNQLKTNPALADGGRVDGGSGGAPYIPSCPTGETCLEGTCVQETVSPGALPAFTGLANLEAGACLPVQCFMSDHAVTPGGSPCSFPAPTGSTEGEFNVAIVTSTGEGTCLQDGTCLVPLEEGPDGWRLQNGAVVLPEAVCATHAKVVYTTQCPSMTAGAGVCHGPGGTLSDAGGASSRGSGSTTTSTGATTGTASSTGGSTATGSTASLTRVDAGLDGGVDGAVGDAGDARAASSSSSTASGTATMTGTASTRSSTGSSPGTSGAQTGSNSTESSGEPSSTESGSVATGQPTSSNESSESLVATGTSGEATASTSATETAQSSTEGSAPAETSSESSEGSTPSGEASTDSSETADGGASSESSQPDDAGGDASGSGTTSSSKDDAGDSSSSSSSETGTSHISTGCSVIIMGPSGPIPSGSCM